MPRPSDRRRPGTRRRTPGAGRDATDRPTRSAAARLALTAALAIAAAGVPVAGSAAAQEEIVDAGSYELRVNGEVVGSEAFTVRREGRTVQGVGRHQVSSASPPFRSLEVWLQVDESWQPTVFRLQAGADERTNVLAVRDDGRFRVRTGTPAGDRWREFVAPAGLVVLEPTAAHHYGFVLRQHGEGLEAGEKREISALVPSRNDRLTLTLGSGPEEDLPWGEGTVPARRYDLTLGSERLRVWTHEDGRVLRVESTGGWAMVRTVEEE